MRDGVRVSSKMGTLGSGITEGVWKDYLAGGKHLRVKIKRIVAHRVICQEVNSKWLGSVDS